MTRVILNIFIKLLNFPYTLFSSPEPLELLTHFIEARVLDFDQLREEDFVQRPVNIEEQQQELIIQQDLLLAQQEQLISEQRTFIQDQGSTLRFYQRREHRQRHRN